MWNLELRGLNSINNLKVKLYKGKGIDYVRKIWKIFYWDEKLVYVC